MISQLLDLSARDIEFGNKFLSLETQLNYKKMIVEGKISCVTSSHLGQQHNKNSHSNFNENMDFKIQALNCLQFSLSKLIQSGQKKPCAPPTLTLSINFNYCGRLVSNPKKKNKKLINCINSTTLICLCNIPQYKLYFRVQGLKIEFFLVQSQVNQDM